MRGWSIVLVVAALATVTATVAAADPKTEVEAVVTKHLTNVLTGRVADTMTADAVLYIANGSREPAHASDIKFELMDDLADKGVPTTKLGKLEVTVDAGAKLGWFTAPLAVTYTTKRGKPATQAVRVGGFVVDDGAGGGWKIAAVQYARPVSDAVLVSKDLVELSAIDPTRFTGDATVLAGGKAMFATGFAKTAGTNAGIHAVGTAPAEVATTAKAAAALAKNWDSAKLEPIDMRARKIGKLGVVQGMARWPVKGKAAVMNYLGGLVEDGGTWRWVGLYWDGS